LSSTSMGIYIPAVTGRRVVYGHPFETANADEMKKKVEIFFVDDMNSEQRTEFLRANSVRLIYCGPKERGFCDLELNGIMKRAFANNSISLYYPFSP
jgi:hypothetical protein